MTISEMKSLQQLVGRADYLGRLRDRRTISQRDYIRLLNEVRQEHGLAPIPVSVLDADRNPEALQHA